MNKKSLEDQLRKLEEKLNLEPPRQAWSKIESQLHVRKDRKKLFYRMIWLQSAAALILVFGLCLIAYFMHKNDKQKMPLADIPVQETVIQETAKAPVAEPEAKESATELPAIPAKEKSKEKNQTRNSVESSQQQDVSNATKLSQSKKAKSGPMTGSVQKEAAISKVDAQLWPRTIRSPYYGKLNGAQCYASIKSSADNSLWTINKSGSEKVFAKLVFQKEAKGTVLFANIDGRVYVFNFVSESPNQWRGIAQDNPNIVLTVEQNDDKISLELKDNVRSVYHQLSLEPTYE